MRKIQKILNRVRVALNVNWLNERFECLTFGSQFQLKHFYNTQYTYILFHNGILLKKVKNQLFFLLSVMLYFLKFIWI